jgi:hypothetical protein
MRAGAEHPHHRGDPQELTAVRSIEGPGSNRQIGRLPGFVDLDVRVLLRLCDSEGTGGMLELERIVPGAMLWCCGPMVEVVRVEYINDLAGRVA